MNFFGHAVVASRICADPEFVLGAMMPDFESMVVETANRFTTPGVVEGVQAHHATDHVFHNSERFLRFQAEARRELQAAQVRTGPRRAVAHVGVELLLDAALGAAIHRTALYKAALRAGLQYTTLAGASFIARAKFSTLFSSLLTRAPHVVARTPDDVVSRLERIFVHRPALSLQPAELPAVSQWAQRAWGPVACEAEAWLSDLVESVAQHLNPTGAPLNVQARSTPTKDASI